MLKTQQSNSNKITSPDAKAQASKLSIKLNKPVDFYFYEIHAEMDAQ